jgi:hypothetical protein
MEVWKSVKGYEGLYEVSNTGKIKSLDRVFIHKDGRERLYIGKMRKLVSDKAGYQTVILRYLDKKPFCAKVHRLVAEAFLINKEDYKEVHHKDEDKANNSVNNLEWCSRSYNMKESLSKSCVLINNKGERCEVNCYNEFERNNNLHKGSISRLVSGKFKQTKGWRLCQD